MLVTGKDYDLRIADFGISTKLGFDEGKVYDAVGSLAYSSPELVKGEPYSYKTDIWALGCIIYELVTKQQAFRGGSEDHIRQKITSLMLPKLTEQQCSPDLIQIYEYCLERDVDKRPTAQELLNLPLVSKNATLFRIRVNGIVPALLPPRP